jgi:hypothetical protein
LALHRVGSADSAGARKEGNNLLANPAAPPCAQSNFTNGPIKRDLGPTRQPFCTVSPDSQCFASGSQIFVLIDVMRGAGIRYPTLPPAVGKVFVDFPQWQGMPETLDRLDAGSQPPPAVQNRF